jgi:predicted alpha/beta hydrolase family esterase
MSKTPYEVRLELLKMANEILVTPIFQTRDARLQEYHSKLTDANRESLPFPTLPDFPSATDVIVKAEELKKFVDQA